MLRPLAPTLLFLLFAIAPALRAQFSDSASKRIVATRAVAPMRVDGRLDAAEWEGASFVDDFTQKDPAEGAAPSERTELTIRFDDDALYVGARMHRRDPSRIHRSVTRRDDVGNTERIIISLDTYDDRRTAYSFTVSAAGGRSDYYHATDDEYDRDFSFDPVWEAETRIDDRGWTAEMRIPFSQLRFNDAEIQRWGINIDRWIPDLNEDIYWVMVPKSVNGWASRFGALEGLEGIRPGLRLELMPYVAGSARFADSTDARNPFDDRFEARAGLDLKLGIGPNLTLDATVNPDFGQVDADPAQVNLSAFETFFDERRPFFVEGAQLLRGDGASYFYSRRIGGPPHLGHGGDFVDAPGSSTILGAAKLTGRLPGGLSIGALGAITERETAHGYDLATELFDTSVVEPLTTYGVLRLQQELGTEGSTVGAIATVVDRALEPGSRAARLLPRFAASGGVDYTIRFDGGAWMFEGHAGGSHVAGDSTAILRLQRSSARYFDRPDAEYVEVDPSLRSLSGAVVEATLSKNTGRWRGYLGGQTETPGLELNDIGQLGTADDIDLWGGVNFHETEPGALFRNYRLGFSADAGWNYGGVATYRSLNLDASGALLSFWNLGAWGGLNLPASNDNLSRGGPLMGAALGGYFGINVSTPGTDKVRGWLDINTSLNAIGGWSLDLDPGVSAELGDQWSLSVSPHFSRSQTPRQYVATLDGGPAATFDRRYVFARIDQTYLSAQVRLSYVVTPHLSVDLYAEPFAGAGRYHDFGELPTPGTTDIRRYEASGGRVSRVDEYTVDVDDGGARFSVDAGDFTYLSFRSNLVVRWEWLPGSTAYLVWQRNAEDSRPLVEGIRPHHLGDAVTAFGDQVIALKVSYWIPVD